MTPSDPHDEPPSTAPQPLSFDPSTWLGPTPAVQPPPSAPPPVAGRGRSRRGLLIGLGLGAGAAVVGGAAVWRSMQGRPAPALALKGAAAGSRYVFTLTSLTDLDQALTAYGLNGGESSAIVAAAQGAMPAAGPQDLRVELALAGGSAPALQSLAVTRPDGSGVTVKPMGASFKASPLAASTRLQTKIAHGQMDSEGFYTSAVSAGLSDDLIPAFFQAFVYDFDFQREILPGDVFEAAFEETVNGQDEAIGAKRLIYASMTTKAKACALYSFTAQGQPAGWFDGAGRSIQRGLMKTPVLGARISSGFGMRFHPVLGFTRMHKGTDFATPVGTPVFASGAGKITFMGVHGGHGNYIAIEHTPTLSTAYAHLSKFEDGLQVGSSVAQGQQIALSGNTGLSSGPHVHYEVIVNGQQVDSQTYQSEAGHVLAGAELAAFLHERDRIDAERVASL